MDNFNLSDTEEGQKIRLTIPARYHGARLDRFLADYLVKNSAHPATSAEEEALLGPSFSRSHVSQWIQGGHVQCSGRTCKSSYRVKEGEELLLTIPPAKRINLEPVDLGLSVFYQDASLAVVYKPPGIAVHPGAGLKGPTLVQGLLHAMTQLSGINGRIRPGIVHRLDKETEGLLVVAKDDCAHDHLSRQFAQRKVTKRYRAVVRGIPSRRRQILTGYLRRHPHQRIKMQVTEEAGRWIKTGYRVALSYPGSFSVSLLHVDLFTGRTHQIRAHLAWIGHPVVGDVLYGGGSPCGAEMFLQSYYLDFIHPRTGQRMRFAAPLPVRFKNCLRLQ